MRVIIAEKPSVAREIAQALGKPERREGYLVVGDTAVTWAFGHLYEVARLTDPWKLEALPILPQRFEYEPIEGGKAQIRVIQHLLSQATEAVCACDAGREGELIFRLIVEQAGFQGKILRLWTSAALSADVVRQEMERLRPGNEYASLYQAALARQHADWIVGINLTRLISLKAADRSVWSVGRVQTPILRLIVDREHEIRDFQPVPYWQIRVQFVKDGKAFSGWVLVQKEKNLSEKNAAEAILRDIEATATAKVQEVQTERKQQAPPLLHSLTSLQREANERQGMTAGRALEIAQDLYEAKLISYPRSDANHLDETPATADMVRRLLGELGHADLVPAVATAGKRVFDTSKLTDHYAIIPQQAFPESSSLTEEHRAIYGLIVRRFLGAFMPAHLFDQTTADLMLGPHLARATGKAIVQEGWRSLYRQELSEDEKDLDEKDQTLPILENGETVAKSGQELLSKKTQPPKRYTEASLLAAMERLGLGTPATRAAIIERLKKVSYIRLDKKALLPTAKADELIEKIHDRPIADPATTAQWEEALEAIYRKDQGREGYQAFMREIQETLRQEVQALRGARIESRPETVGTCACGGGIEERPKTFICQSCKRMVWKEICGKKLTTKQALGLLAGKKVELKGLKSKAGKEFTAKAELDAAGKVQFTFDTPPVSAKINK